MYPVPFNEYYLLSVKPIHFIVLMVYAEKQGLNVVINFMV